MTSALPRSLPGLKYCPCCGWKLARGRNVWCCWNDCPRNDDRPRPLPRPGPPRGNRFGMPDCWLTLCITCWASCVSKRLISSSICSMVIGFRLYFIRYSSGVFTICWIPPCRCSCVSWLKFKYVCNRHRWSTRNSNKWFNSYHETSWIVEFMLSAFA